MKTGLVVDLPGAQLDEEELKQIAADPKFIEILARNIAFYLKHGHDGANLCTCTEEVEDDACHIHGKDGCDGCPIHPKGRDCL